MIIFSQALFCGGGGVYGALRLKTCLKVVTTNLRYTSLINNWIVREGLGPRGIWGLVQGVGLMGWVNTRPQVCGTPYGMA